MPVRAVVLNGVGFFVLLCCLSVFQLQVYAAETAPGGVRPGSQAVSGNSADSLDLQSSGVLNDSVKVNDSVSGAAAETVTDTAEGISVADPPTGDISATDEPAADAPKDTVRIIITRNVTVKYPETRLGDIAIIEAPEDISEEIAAMPVTDSPKPGRQKNFRTAGIRNALESRFRDKNSLILDMPDIIIIKTDFQQIPEKTLRDFYEKKALETSGGDAAGISDFRVRGKNIFPAGNFEIKPVAVFRGMNMGNFSLPVEVYIDGKMEGRLTLSGKIEKNVRVVCALRDIRKNEIISASDIRIEKLGAEKRMGVGFLTDTSLAVGKQTRSDIKTGAVLYEKNLFMPSVLKKGDRVRLVAKSGRLTIETLAEAMSDGKSGERIRVRNIDTGKLVSATVIDSGTVETVF